ncbi:uncharacterized protein LOC106882446, partial [Octopus bimaculoides]|uniref:uncharacterized protein LOC106882446 n=1 Tax=Octopus bimaculoides TaxID=37653 RepID=UPI00071CC94B
MVLPYLRVVLLVSWVTFCNDFPLRLYIESVAKLAAMKVGSLLRLMSYLTFETILYAHKFTIHPVIEYCCRIWAGAPVDYLTLLGHIHRHICNAIGPDPSSELDSLSHCRHVASLSLF